MKSFATSSLSTFRAVGVPWTVGKAQGSYIKDGKLVPHVKLKTAPEGKRLLAIAMRAHKAGKSVSFVQREADEAAKKHGIYEVVDLVIND